MNIAPIIIPKLNDNNIDLLIQKKKTKISFSFLDQSYNVNFNATPISIQPSSCLIIELVGLPLHVLLGDYLINEFLPKNLHCDALRQLPEDIMSAVVKKALSPIIFFISQKLNLSCQFLSFKLDTDEEIMNYITIEIEKNDIKNYLVVSSNEALLSLINMLPSENKFNYDTLPLTIFLNKGNTVLTYHDLKGLDCGDIILFDSFVSDKEVILNVEEQFFCIAKIDNNKIILTSGWNDMDDENELSHDNIFTNEMSEEMNGSELDISQLQFKLVFGVGEKKLNLEDLHNLNLGSVLELENSIDKPVTIKTNGRIIGYGELVEINNRLGVRILEFKDRNS